jgi:Fe-Mn family superoxide dismutase
MDAAPPARLYCDRRMGTRREFLALSTAAALTRPGSAAALADEASALSTGKLKPLKNEEIPGFLSKEQLSVHHTAHYGGALSSLKQIETELEGADPAKANANYAPIRELKREQIHALNSVVLHELYFDGLTAQSGAPGESSLDALKKRFGSMGKWLDDFRAAAVAARGWAMLALQPVNGKLYNISTDVHDVGPMVSGVPLVVIDCYEHAYYIDYKNKKADYVASFATYMDWAEIERRFRATVK